MSCRLPLAVSAVSSNGFGPVFPGSPLPQSIAERGSTLREKLSPPSARRGPRTGPARWQDRYGIARSLAERLGWERASKGTSKKD